MESFAYDNYLPEYEEIDYELIGGEKFYMSAAAPNIPHGLVIIRIATIFTNYIDKTEIQARVLGDNVDVYFSDEDHFKPDVSVVRDLSIFGDGKRIYGAPDLVVEVLSDSTKDNDSGIKKDKYEQYGVKEYWIVDPKEKSIKVYNLVESKFKYVDEYKINSNKTKIKVSIFDNLLVDVHEVFKWWL